MNWRGVTFALLSLTILAGCGQAATVLRLGATDGAAAADQLLMTTEWAYCNALSIGSVRREFGQNPDRMAAYNELCAKFGGEVEVVSGD